MKILLICNKSPWPPKEGGPIAMNAIIEGLLNAGHQLKVIAINSNKYAVDTASIPQSYREKTNIELVYVNLSIKPIDAFFNLFTSESYHVKRFIQLSLSKAIEHALANDNYDIVQFETLYITPYLPIIRKLSSAKVILRAHNIEFLIWERLYRSEKNIIKRFYLRHLYRTLKKYELDAINQFDGIVAITQKDADFFKTISDDTKVIAVPFGISASAVEQSHSQKLSPSANVVFHLGSMNWLPNLEGVEWFLKTVWPSLKKSVPGITLRLAGREMPQWIKALNDPHITVDGEVPDAITYMKKHRIMIVPLFSGSGIRIKIVEGMAASCAIITTSIGAEGIEYVNGKHLLIANDAAAFVNAVVTLTDNPQLVDSIGQEASNLITKNHNNDLLIRKLESFYSQITN